MKKEDLFQALGEIDDNFLDENVTEIKYSTSWITALVSIAACIAFTAGLIHFVPKPPDSQDNQIFFPVSETETSVTTQTEIFTKSETTFTEIVQIISESETFSTENTFETTATETFTTTATETSSTESIFTTTATETSTTESTFTTTATETSSTESTFTTTTTEPIISPYADKDYYLEKDGIIYKQKATPIHIWYAPYGMTVTDESTYGAENLGSVQAFPNMHYAVYFALHWSNQYYDQYSNEEIQQAKNQVKILGKTFENASRSNDKTTLHCFQATDENYDACIILEIQKLEALGIRILGYDVTADNNGNGKIYAIVTKEQLQNLPVSESIGYLAGTINYYEAETFTAKNTVETATETSTTENPYSSLQHLFTEVDGIYYAKEFRDESEWIPDVGEVLTADGGLGAASLDVIRAYPDKTYAVWIAIANIDGDEEDMLSEYEIKAREEFNTTFTIEGYTLEQAKQENNTRILSYFNSDRMWKYVDIAELERLTAGTCEIIGYNQHFNRIWINVTKEQLESLPFSNHFGYLVGTMTYQDENYFTLK